MTTKSTPIYRFGIFELDVQSGELRKNGTKLKIQEQSVQVLALLLANPGTPVTREELRNQLWPADTFVDFDHSINAAIKRLREVLSDEAENPRFIETLPRRGYRFIAPVDGFSGARGTGIVAAPERSKSSFWRHRGAIAFLSALVVAVLLLAVWRFPSRHGEVIERRLTANSSENSVSRAAVSPDGRYLAYADNTGIYLKQIRTGETHSVPLPPNFSAMVDDWFPDGSHLLVSHQEEPGKISLWSISVFGGSPRQLTNDGAGGSVSPDGAHIAFQRLGYGREEWVMRSDGTDPVRVATDKSTWVGPPTWSPDGNRIAYIRSNWTYNAPVSSLEVNEWRNATAETLFAENRLGPAVYWLRNGHLIYTLGDANSQQDAGLWMVSLQGSAKTAGSPQRITRAPGWISQVTASSDGKIISLVREQFVSSVYIGALAPGGAHLLTHRRLTLDDNENHPFGWTPDSKAVLFNSNRNGTFEIFKQATDQPLAETLATSGEQLSQPKVTPDASEILYISTPKSAEPETRSSIFAIPVAGGPPRLVLQDASIWNVQCARLPSTLCMYSITEGDSTKTFRFDVKSGKSSDPPQVDPLCNWSLSPDGSQRAIVSSGRKGTIRLRSTLTGQTRELVVKGWNEFGGIDWTRDGGSLLVASRSSERDGALLNVTLDGRVSVMLHSSNTEILAAIPSPDGRSLAIAEATRATNVWKIENF